jgi:hypothetical protein
VGDVASFVIAPRDGIEELTPGEINFVVAELRLAQQLIEDFENVVEVFLQAGKRNGG